ncbi:uncharacterized protein [Dysidea avara]|uniref:uncharacterized protein isoform X3 n=1 Tax=Dysidea avara TaxID=196820 RepID=UPI0033188BD9
MGDMGGQGQIMDRTPTSLVQLKRCVAFRIADRWHDIGIQLKFGVEELDQIDKNNQSPKVEECCKAMLYSWKRRTTGVMAKELIDAIEEAGNAAYASQLTQVNQERLLDLTFLESDVVPRIATEWFDVGLYLDIPEYDLSNIKHLSNPCGSKCIDMLGRWLRRNPNHPDNFFRPTWRNMYNAMIAIDYVRPAEELKEDLMNLNGI